MEKRQKDTVVSIQGETLRPFFLFFYFILGFFFLFPFLTNFQIKKIFQSSLKSNLFVDNLQFRKAIKVEQLQLIIICDNFTRKEMQTVTLCNLYIAIKIKRKKNSSAFKFKFLGENLSSLSGFSALNSGDKAVYKKIYSDKENLSF